MSACSFFFLIFRSMLTNKRPGASLSGRGIYSTWGSLAECARMLAPLTISNIFTACGSILVSTLPRSSRWWGKSVTR